MTTLHDFWRCVGTAFGHFVFGLSDFHGHGSWLMCEAALSLSNLDVNRYVPKTKVVASDFKITSIHYQFLLSFMICECLI